MPHVPWFLNFRYFQAKSFTIHAKIYLVDIYGFSWATSIQVSDVHQILGKGAIP